MIKLINHVSVFVVFLTMSWMISLSSIESTKNPELFPAMFIFGDSLIDPGNNIPMVDSLAKANFPPYGIDSDTGLPTGRFTNGKTLIDFLGELLGLPPIPSYVDTISSGASVTSGVNYASAGAGILQDSGYIYIRVIPLSEQINNFKNTLTQLSKQMEKEEMSNYLANAIVILAMGANDYIDNYLLPPYRTVNPQHLADLLINLYTQYILEIKNLGVRKFLISEVGPIGCMPIVVNTGLAPPGQCVSTMNSLVEMFNSRLKTDLVDKLNSDYNPQTLFTLAAAFQQFIDLRDNADAYGLKVKDKTCILGSVNKIGKVSVPNSLACSNRDEYLFWDFAHPTQAVHRILANQLFNNNSLYYPYTLNQLANM